MAYKLTVPGPMGDIEEVRILQWHSNENSKVSEGDQLVELETDKAIIEVRAKRSGFMRKHLIPAGEWLVLGRAGAVLTDTLDESMPSDVENLPLFETDAQAT